MAKIERESQIKKGLIIETALTVNGKKEIFADGYKLSRALLKKLFQYKVV